VKYNASGYHQWSARYGGAEKRVVERYCRGCIGNVINLGKFNGTVDFGGGGLVSAGGGDAFLAKFNTSGAHQWSKRFGSTLADYCYTVATDASGNVFAAGSFTGTVSFGGSNLVGAGNSTCFSRNTIPLASTSGASASGARATTRAYGVASGPVGKRGYHGSFLRHGGFRRWEPGERRSYEVFLARYNSAGTHQWSRRFGSANYDEGDAVAMDASGNVYLAGIFSGNHQPRRWQPDLGRRTGYLPGQVQLRGYAPVEQALRRRRYRVQRALAVDAFGGVVLVGSFFSTTIDFGGGPLTSAGDFDVCLGQVRSAGLHRWSMRGGGTLSDDGFGVALDATATSS